MRIVMVGNQSDPSQNKRRNRIWRREEEIVEEEEQEEEEEEEKEGGGGRRKKEKKKEEEEEEVAIVDVLQLQSLQIVCSTSWPEEDRCCEIPASRDEEACPSLLPSCTCTSGIPGFPGPPGPPVNAAFSNTLQEGK
ncbi:collagen alpha-1XX chain [Crotalus adamanteus]|uniref:Collagen alpha-1XX chain n=1 Tax=Crotalus adamanteus TaxID=8729 RepID=A0AAW1BRB6_CROAD